MIVSGVTIIILLLFHARACATKVNQDDDVHKFIDKVANKLRDRLLHRAHISLRHKMVGSLFDLSLQAPCFHFLDLTDTAIGKPGHQAVPLRASPRPLLACIRGSPSSGSRWPQLVRRATPGRHIQATPGQQMQAKQLWQFTEPETDVNVKLVGVMHYHPVSIKLVSDTIEELAEDGKLASVVLESCDLRWTPADNSTSFLKSFLRSEMRTASDLALSYNRPVVLGDMRINATLSKMGQALETTMKDLVRSIQGRERIAQKMDKTRSDGFRSGGYLDMLDVTDFEFMLGVPVTIFKNLLTYFLTFPVPVLSFLLVLIFLLTPDDQMPEGSLALAALTIVVPEMFFSVVDEVLLEERNAYLATSILQQCRMYQNKKRRTSSPLFQQRSNDIMSVSESKNDTDDMNVVAVLGLAHCNDVMKLLRERQVH